MSGAVSQSDDRELTPFERQIAASTIMGAYKGKLVGELRDKCIEVLKEVDGGPFDKIADDARRILSECRWFRNGTRDAAVLEHAKAIEVAAVRMQAACRPAGAKCGLCTEGAKSDATRTCTRCGMHVCESDTYENPGRPDVCIECHNEWFDDDDDYYDEHEDDDDVQD